MKKADSLIVSRLTAIVDGKKVLHGVSLTVRPGTVHVIMGPNGSGKSTLANAMMGHPDLTVSGSISVNNCEVLKKSPDERARLGLYLAFQSPVAIPGVSVVSLLRESFRSRQTSAVAGKTASNPAFFRGGSRQLAALVSEIKNTAAGLGIAGDFLSRGIHDGFSGGEKKKMEMLEALVLKPSYAVFDEIDTGLDVDSLKTVAAGIAKLAAGGTGVLVITHYRRITDYLPADRVHILVSGRIVATGSRDIITRIEAEGYSRYTGSSKKAL